VTQPPYANQPDPGSYYPYGELQGYPNAAAPSYSGPEYGQPGAAPVYVADANSAPPPYPYTPTPPRSRTPLLVGGLVAGLVLIVVTAVAVVVHSIDTKDRTAQDPQTHAAAGAANPSPNTPATTTSGGSDQSSAAQEICSKIDYSPLNAFFGSTRGNPSQTRRETGGNVTLACAQDLRLDNKHYANFTATVVDYTDSSAASRSYQFDADYARTQHAKSGSIRDVTGVGDKAVVLRWDSNAAGSFDTWELLSINGNKQIRLRVLGYNYGTNWTEDQSKQIMDAIVSSAKNTVPRL
jgi:hypothetical protein